MLEETSIARQLQRDRSFIPPYCPNTDCKHHLGGVERFASPYGGKVIKRFPYYSRRFACDDCGQTFTASFFRLDYRQKVWGHNEAIFVNSQKGVSMRQSARELNKTEDFVRYRLLRMQRFALLKHVKLSGELKIKEAIVYDGLENFAFSQFDPNNINQAVGKKSLFIYDFNFAPLNRKGRMSPFQKRKKKLIENKHGRYAPDAIRSSTARIFERLIKRAGGEKLTLYSDRHFQYRRAIEWDLQTNQIEHIRVSSKIARNFRNDLFAVNNIDLQARHNLSAFKRETIAFSKHSIAMLETFSLYACYRNYMRPKFWGTHRSDPLSSKKSPAMELGVADRILSFDEFFRERVCLSQVKLHEDFKNLYRRIDPMSRRPIRVVD